MYYSHIGTQVRLRIRPERIDLPAAAASPRTQRRRTAPRRGRAGSSRAKDRLKQGVNQGTQPVVAFDKTRFFGIALAGPKTPEPRALVAPLRAIPARASDRRPRRPPVLERAPGDRRVRGRDAGRSHAGPDRRPVDGLAGEGRDAGRGGAGRPPTPRACDGGWWASRTPITRRSWRGRSRAWESSMRSWSTAGSAWTRSRRRASATCGKSAPGA